MADIKNIVSFGCSWTYGDEVIDPKLEKQGYDHFHRYNDEYRQNNCFVGQLASKYNLKNYNYSYPGSSLQSMQWCLIWWLNKFPKEEIEKSLVVVGLTGESRTSWWEPEYGDNNRDDPNHFIHSTWLEFSGPNVDEGWFKLSKYYYAMTACDSLSQLNIDTTTTLFDGISSKYNIPVLQFNTVATMKPTNIKTFYDINVRRQMSKEHFAKGGHPNVSGHTFIANKLTEIINTNKLLG